MPILIAEDTGADEKSAGGGGTFFTELQADPGALGLVRSGTQAGTGDHGTDRLAGPARGVTRVVVSVWRLLRSSDRRLRHRPVLV